MFHQVLWPPQDPQTDTPLRPIVSSYESVSYVAKELAKILKPPVGKSLHYINSTQDFVEQVKHITLGPGECFSSYVIIDYRGPICPNNQAFCTGDQTSFPTWRRYVKHSGRALKLWTRGRSWSVFSPHQPQQPSTSQVRQAQPAAGMYMPYIEGPCMDWTVNDGLYHRFLKWHLKCENILECKLAALLEHQQCKKVIAWSRDCRMDQYVSWNLSSDKLTLETILGKYKDEFQTRKL